MADEKLLRIHSRRDRSRTTQRYRPLGNLVRLERPVRVLFHIAMMNPVHQFVSFGIMHTKTKPAQTWVRFEIFAYHGYVVGSESGHVVVQTNNYVALRYLYSFVSSGDSSVLVKSNYLYARNVLQNFAC